MIVLLSPAKTLDYTPSGINDFTEPRLLDRSEELVGVLRKKSVKNLKGLMKVSDNIAQLNAERFASFTTPLDPSSAKQAILAFKGDVYIGLDAHTLEDDDLDFAQKHVRILSGLYGLLKPMDLMHPYRLEMGTPLKVKRKKNLYDFWGGQITELINQDLKEAEGSFIINLASQEYFHAVKPALLEGKLIHIHFKENRDGKLKVISFNAKKARGAMARKIILGKIMNPEELKEFVIDGYTFDPTLSGMDDYVFVK